MFLLCCLPALAEATNRDHFCRLASSSASASQKISVTFFSGTTQASFLIFGAEHQYGQLYRVTHFWICGMSTSCFTRLWILWQICSQDNFCHIFIFKRKEVGRRHVFPGRLTTKFLIFFLNVNSTWTVHNNNNWSMCSWF